ncbi:MAG: DNA gyrase subunit A [Planctomycetaceae bacterium]|nr:DNA gyrase subunit A [Planctomycetaceae bacterium]
MSDEVDLPDPQPDDEGGAPPIVHGSIVDLPIDRELQDSYLTYAMSTIMDRALPDVRDGLKPSQRRILVAMNDLNLGPRSKHRKCAKIAGDTSGNYHPHGESVVYPTLVNMGQHWRMRHPLVDPQGNFGSIDGDPPAAMRYTEARLAAPASEMLEDLKLDTVDYQENYDATRDEPTVLPAKFPNLLINGGIGIAVGMATSLPPHNLGEICDAIAAVIDNPDLELGALMEIVPGPDFPTGGTICGRQGIAVGYATGRGRVVIRAKTHFEEKANRTNIVVTEIPYNVLKTTIIDQIVEAVKADKIKDISDVNDYSGREGMRLIIECKRGADENVVLNQLYQYTSLQNTFSIMNIALVNRQPRTMGLKELIQHFIDHRRDVIVRRTRYRLRHAQQQAHIQEGLIYAVCDIDEVIKLIRESSARDEAIEKLMARGFRIPPDHPFAPKIPARLLEQSADDDIALTKVQAEAIGRMQLIQLVGLEIEKLAQTYTALIEEIEGYELILRDEDLVLDIIREDTLEIKEKYANPRRTVIEGEEVTDIVIADLIPVEDVVLTISHAGYVKRLPKDAYRTQGRGGRGVKGADTRDDDFTEHLFVASTHDDMLCFTNTGRVFKMKVYEVPQASRTGRGRAIVNLLNLRDDKQVCAFLPINDFEKGEDFLVFATAHGLVKRTSLKLYRNVHRAGLIAVNLKDNDKLIGVALTTGDNDLILCTRTGMAIRFDEADARTMGRAAAGVKGISLAKDDAVVAMVIADDHRQLLTVCENGYGKRTDMTEYLVQAEDGSTRRQKRGGKGRLDIRTTTRNGPVVAALSTGDDDQMMLISEGGMIVRTKVGEVSRVGRATQGVRVINLKAGDRLVAATPLEDANGDDPLNGDTANPDQPQSPTADPASDAVPPDPENAGDDNGTEA